jgi:hypothetical protein
VIGRKKKEIRGKERPSTELKSRERSAKEGNIILMLSLKAVY